MNRHSSPWFGLMLAAAAVILVAGCPPAGSSDDGDGNAAPTLSAEGVNPDSGDPSTTFTYQVQYNDADSDAPSAIKVHIDGTPFDLTLLSGAASDGVYTYQTTLTPGIHACYFSCEDGNGGSARLPASGEVSGPTVSTPGNNAPALGSGGVSPASGDTATTFTYSVGYSDPDGDAPAVIAVYVDGAAKAMTLAAGIASNGTYEYSTTLSAASHNYYFDCEDGNGGSDREPAAGTLSGPAVTAGKNTLSGSVSYTGSETIGVTRPLRVEVWDPASWTLVDSVELTASPYSFGFDLDPETYVVVTYIDSDQSDDLSEDDIFVVYDGIWFLDDYDLVDLSSGDNAIAIALDDSNVYAFLEDFEDGTADGWVPMDGRWQVVSGEYRMVGITDDKVTASLHPCADQDFTFSVSDLRQLAGYTPTGDWGLLFRFNGVDTGYVLGVENDGWWGIYTVPGSLIYEEKTFSPGDTVTVRMIGHTVTVYINGVQEYSANLSAYGYTGSYVGVYAWDDSPTSTDNVFAYDDIWLVLHP